MPDTVLPWKAPDSVFPRRPKGVDFGYVPKGKTRDHLVAVDDLEELRLYVKEHATPLVAVPDFKHLVHPAFVADLDDITAAKDRKGRRRDVKKYGLLTLLFSIPLVLDFDAQQPLAVLSDPWFLFVFIFGIYPLGQVAFDHFRTSKKPEDELEVDAFLRWCDHLACRPLRLLCGALIVVYIAQVIDNRFLAPGGDALQKVVAGRFNTITQGDWVRPLVATVSHGNILHIGFNVIGLFILGRWSNAFFGWWTTCAVLYFSMLSGAGFSLWLPPDGSTVGISGGICGILGWLWGTSRFLDREFPKGFHKLLRGMIIGLTVYGIAGYGFIDNAAHFGGFFGGIILAYLANYFGRLRPYPPEVLPLGTIPGMISALAIATGVVLALVRHLSPV